MIGLEDSLDCRRRRRGARRARERRQHEERDTQQDGEQTASHGPETVAQGHEPHVPTADSSHSPKLVNATITASIQYWLRTASSGSL